MNSRAWIKPVALLVAVLAAAAAGYYVVYARPRAALLSQLEDKKSRIASYTDALKEARQVKQELRTFAAGTLSPKADQATAQFRSALGAIATANGMAEADVVVNTNKPEAVMSPAGSKLRTALGAELKKQPDFWVMKGSVEGKGSLEQVLRVAAVVQNQPWIHRVDSFSIKPEGKARDRFTLKLGVATLLMPADLAPKESPDLQIKPLAEADGARFASIIAKNVFKEPAPVVAQAAPTSQQAGPQAAPPPPPYNEWKLTGVVESRLGVEAFLVNTRSGQHMSLPAGAIVAEAKFVSGAGERAVFEIGGQQYEVFNGQTLEQRRPKNR